MRCCALHVAFVFIAALHIGISENEVRALVLFSLITHFAALIVFNRPYFASL